MYLVQATVLSLWWFWWRWTFGLRAEMPDCWNAETPPTSVLDSDPYHHNHWRRVLTYIHSELVIAS